MRLNFLLAIFVLSILVILPIADAQNIVTGQATRTFTKIVPSLAVSITENVLAPTGTPLTEIRIDVNTIVLQAIITAEATDPEKSELPVLPGGVVYSYMNITAKNIDDSDLDSFKMKFRVPKSWMSANSVAPESVKMLRFSSGAWDDIPTSIISEDSDQVAYESESPGFSVFAIAGEGAPPQLQEEPQQTAVEQPEITEAAPGEDMIQAKEQDGLVWIAAGIVVVVIIAALFLVPGSFLHRKIRK